MPSIVLKAHYDGEHIVLDEPYELVPEAALAVAVLNPASIENDEEHSNWTSLGIHGLAEAYGDNEPQYTTGDLRS